MTIRAEFKGDSQIRFEGLEGWVGFTPAGNSPQHFRVTDIKTKKIEKILLDRGALFRCLNMPDMEAPGWTKKLPEIVFFCSQYCGTLLKVIDYTQDLWRHSSIKPLPRDDAAKIAGAITWTVLFAPKGGHLHIHKGVFNTVFGFYLLRTTKNGISHVYLELELELEIDIASAERKQSESDRKIKEQDDPLLLDLNENPFGIFSVFSLKSACRFTKEMPRVSEIVNRSGIAPKKQNGVKKKVNSRLTAPIRHVRARSEKSPPPPKSHRRAVSGVAAVPAPKPPLSPTKKPSTRLSPQRPNSRLTLAIPSSPPHSPPGMLIRGTNRGDPHVQTKSAQRKRISSPPPARHPTSSENLRALKKRVEATRKRSMSARAPVDRPTAASPPPMSPPASPFRKIIQLPLNPSLDSGVSPGPLVKLDQRPEGEAKRPPYLDIAMDDSDGEQ